MTRCALPSCDGIPTVARHPFCRICYNALLLPARKRLLRSYRSGHEGERPEAIRLAIEELKRVAPWS